MLCPVCGQDGADEQPVGPTVTVFCCPSCLAVVLSNFASHHEPRRAHGPATPPASPAAHEPVGQA